LGDVLKHSVITALSNKPIDFVPVAQGVNLDDLKNGDNDPLEVIVEIPATKSKRGWNYKPESLKDIVNYVNTETLNGYLGHQRSEDVDTQFPDIQTHWVGGKWDENTNSAYFRGLIDKDATKLKRWIKGKRVKQVSIFGIPKLYKDSSGNVDVIGYKPLSIDWTPLNRAGMPTNIISTTGEMSLDYFGELDEPIKNNDKTAKLLDKIKDKYSSIKLLSENEDSIEILYKDSDGAFQTKKINYDTINNNNNGGVDAVDKNEILKHLKMKYVEGSISDEDINSIIGLTKKRVIDADVANEVGEMSVSDIKEAKTARQENIFNNKKDKQEKIIKEVIESKITGEQAQSLIKDIFITDSLDKDIIAGEIDDLLKKETVKKMINNISNISQPNNQGSSAGSNGGGDIGFLEDNKFLIKK